MANKLNSCSECGGKAKLFVEYENGMQRYVVRCTNCGADFGSISTCRRVDAEHVWNKLNPEKEEKTVGLKLLKPVKRDKKENPDGNDGNSENSTCENAEEEK